MADSPPHFLRDGGVIAAGYDAELDELRLLGSNTEQFLLDLERRERERTGLSSLKLGFNRVQGFFIEVNRPRRSACPPIICAARRSNPPSDSSRRSSSRSRTRCSARAIARWRARRSCTNAARPLIARLPALQATTAALAELDVLACFAERAAALDCVRPELVDEPQLRIEGGRHPVVERASREPFIPNDLRFDDARRMLIITGPNMGGKSTYMRQTALIVILAHIGCFVPAKRAVLGLSIAFSRASARPTISRADARRSCSR